MMDNEDRQREKQTSRDKDAQDLVSGNKTREQLRRENGLIRITKLLGQYPGSKVTCPCFAN